MIRYKECGKHLWDFYGSQVFVGGICWQVATYALIAYPTGIKVFSSDYLFNKTWEELQESYFDDILRPTQIELDCFKLQTGFDWPFIKENMRKGATQIKKEQHNRYDEKVREVLEDPNKKTPAKKSKYSI